MVTSSNILDFFVRTNIIPEGTAVTKVQCGSKQLLDNLLWELKLNIRHAIQWMRNGEPWKEDKSRIEKSKFALGFKRVAASDTGFYSCELDLLGGGKKILKAFSLIGALLKASSHSRPKMVIFVRRQILATLGG